jgi:hypothetical protein
MKLASAVRSSGLEVMVDKLEQRLRLWTAISSRAEKNDRSAGSSGTTG